MVRYLPAPRLRQAGLTTNEKSNTYELYNPFALRYRRVNGTFYGCIINYQETAHEERAALTKLKEPAMTSLIFFRSTGEAALLGEPSPALVILKGISRDKGF